MTYDQAYEKAQTLSYISGFSMIKGYLHHPDNYLDTNQLGLIPLSLTEPNKVVLNTPEWIYLVENMMRFYAIRGNIWTTTDEFFTHGTVAMAVDSVHRLAQVALIKDYLSSGDYSTWRSRFAENGLSRGTWDIAPMPVLKEGDNTIAQPNILSWLIPRQSKMKDTAFQIIMHMLSDEVQLERAKDGIKGVIVTEEIAKSFGTNIPELAGLNLEAVYWGENAVRQRREPEIIAQGTWNVPLWMVFRQYILQQGFMPEMALNRVETEQNEVIQARRR